MTYSWYVIVNRVTGKKRPGGLMHLGKALALMDEILREEATEAELSAYDAAIRERNEDVATSLYDAWMRRCAWMLMERGAYVERSSGEQ